MTAVRQMRSATADPASVDGASIRQPAVVHRLLASLSRSRRTVGRVPPAQQRAATFAQAAARAHPPTAQRPPFCVAGNAVNGIAQKSFAILVCLTRPDLAFSGLPAGPCILTSHLCGRSDMEETPQQR